jgi:hypothetical protein
MRAMTGTILVSWTSDPTHLILDSRFAIEVTVISVISGVQDGKFESFMFLHRTFTNVCLNQSLESPFPLFGFSAANKDKLVRTSPPWPAISDASLTVLRNPHQSLVDPHR